MCGIAGRCHLNNEIIANLSGCLGAMNQLQAHRGPDGSGQWIHSNEHVGFAHNRLSIIDIDGGAQPMTDDGGNWVTYNGEIYNYIELRQELGIENFKTACDTEVILQAYRRWGFDCVNHFRGMFAFALWDERKKILFCARDRIGIKPFYYSVNDRVLSFASEIKALLPFVADIVTDLEALKDYLHFQLCLAGKTLFKDVNELLPGHILIARNGDIEVRRYWEVYFEPDLHHNQRYFEDKLKSLLVEAIELHLRSDVPVGTYLSGGLDSSVVSSLASRSMTSIEAFTGKFAEGIEYDESPYARQVAEWCNIPLHELTVTSDHFRDNIRDIIYYLDFPVAGPGVVPQYMVSQFLSKSRKVALGGQGGDEIFGGYARYLIAYFEQCIKGAIEGTQSKDEFIVTYESIIPNLVLLKQYVPLLQYFWREGLFESMDKRYFRLINRAPTLSDEINWEVLGDYSPYETFLSIFRAENALNNSYFDRMTHFDFKTILPGLLQIEDRVSMAHGLESRVPLLDHKIIELAATMPAIVKFKAGEMKHALKRAARSHVPVTVLERKDKMGFTMPFAEWIKGPLREFAYDLLSSKQALSREIINSRKVTEAIEHEFQHGRKIWGLLCLELWNQEFHDKAASFRKIPEGQQVYTQRT